MVRIFAPAGQGHFAIERFSDNENNYTFIFDCGVFKSKNKINNLIDHELYTNEEIEAVFISHFHEDHVNGLEYLLKYYRVKKIVMPYLNSEDKLALKLNIIATKKYNKWVYDLINSPIDIIRSTSRNKEIIIETVGNEEINMDYINPRAIKSVKTDMVYRFTEDYFREHIWEFVPFCVEEKEGHKKLREAIVRELGKDTYDDLLTNFEKIKSKNKILTEVTKLYNKYFNDLNVKSMIVFSGVKGEVYHQRICTDIYGRQRIPRFSKKIGCLYTGDFNMKDNFDFIKKVYEDYLKFVGVVQIPHHGSKYNYSSELGNMDCIFVICAGKKSAFRHPDREPLIDLIEKEKKVFLVMDDLRDRLEIING